jgi:phage gpG-like protein
MGQVVKSARVPLTLAVQHVIIPSIKENFESEGRPSWDNLNKGTILQRFGAAHPILHRTGTLEEAATSFGIWDIGEQSATVRRLPLDAFYGVYHQAGSTGTSGGGALAELMSHAPHSSAAEAVISRFVPAAKKELGPKASASHVRNRAIGLIIDSEGAWSLPARPFIMWQPEDVPKIELIFSKWMEGVAVKEGGFRDIG